jgi:hypothetical protein
MNVPANLSDAAKLALTSLTEHPELDTPETISNGPFGVDQLDTPEIAEGLKELAAHGLAVEKAGRWAFFRNA